MSVYNPRTVAQALEDINEEMARWTIAARDTLAVASYTQRQAKERVDRAMHHAAIVMDQAEQDEERVRKAISETTELLGKCITAKDLSRNTLEEAQNASQYADSTLQEWEDELAKALAWLKRAEARLARAIEEYERARRAFAQAQSEYERAVSRYQACMNNKDRSNCNSEARAVQVAEAEMRQAAAWVQVAEQEVIAAKEEVEMAKARVACCKAAVAYASQAVSIAQQAEAEAVQAVNSAERGLEFARAAEKLSDAAKEKVTAEKEAAEKMMAATREAVSLTEEAAVNLMSADKAEESSQRYSYGARQELQHRRGLLHELNKANLFANAGNVASVPRPSADATTQFTDRKGRRMETRNWISGNQALVRVFDTANGAAPKIPNRGVGRANATIESNGNVSRVRLQDIEVDPGYQRAGISDRILEQVVQFAKDKDATEIYGVIESAAARDYWASQNKKGWSILDKKDSLYGEAHYKIK